MSYGSKTILAVELSRWRMDDASWFYTCRIARQSPIWSSEFTTCTRTQIQRRPTRRFRSPRIPCPPAPRPASSPETCACCAHCRPRSQLCWPFSRLRAREQDAQRMRSALPADQCHRPQPSAQMAATPAANYTCTELHAAHRSSAMPSFSFCVHSTCVRLLEEKHAQPPAAQPHNRPQQRTQQQRVPQSVRGQHASPERLTPKFSTLLPAADSRSARPPRPVASPPSTFRAQRCSAVSACSLCGAV